MAEILFEHCQLKINEKILAHVQYEKLYEFITSTLQFQISTYKPLIIEKYHVMQQDMLNIMETLKACTASEYKTDFVIIPDFQKHSDQTENTDLKCSSNEVHDIERTPVINSGPRKVVSHEEGISEDESKENMTSCKKIVSKSKMEVNAMNFEQTLQKADPEEMSCLSACKDMNNSESGCKDMNNSESGCKGMNNSEAKAEAKVNDVRKEITTNKLEAQNAGDIHQVQGKSDKNQSEFTFNWPEDWQFECAEWYMDTKFSRSFFNAVVRKDTQVTFRLSNSNPQVKLFIRLLQQLKFEKITFNDGNKQQAQRLAEQVICKTSAKIKVLAGHFMIVGLKEEVLEAEKMIMEKLQSQDKAEYVSSENICMQDENNKGRSRQTFSDEHNEVNRSEYEHMHVKSSELQEEYLPKAIYEGHRSVKCETHNKEKIHERQTQMQREKQMESNKHKTGQSAENKSKQHSESKEDPIDTSLTPDMNEMSDDAEETQETENVCVSEYLLNWTEEWNFECAKQYMNAESYKSFFKNAERKDAQVIFRLDMNDPKAKSFLKLVKQLKFAKIGFNIRNKEQMKRLARELTPETGARIEVADTFFMIVGLKEEVSEAKRMITKKLQSQAEAEFRSSENMHMRDENNMGRSRQTLNDRPNKVSRYEYEHMNVKSSGFHDEHLKTANLSTSELSKNQFPSSQRSCEQGSYQRGHMFQTEKSKLIVQIQKANITTFKADCIVNAANRRLLHHGGVSKAIAEVAGEELMKDCEDYIKTGKTVDVTDIFVSKGGRLPAKFVFHAVGPMWGSYDDKKQCLNDLRCTVLRCLVEAARRGMSSIALPSISAAIFKVPKELCAICYMEAVKHFDIFSAREEGTLQEIHFIDVDDIMVNYIIECFLDNWEKPSDREMLHKDLAFAENHIRSKFKKMSSDYTKPKSSIFSAPSGANETASSTGAVRKSDSSKSYRLGKVTLYLKSGHAFDYSAGITITVGKPFDKLSGLPDFQIKQNLKRDNNMPYRKNKYEFFNVSKPYGKQSRLLLTTYPEPDKVETIEENFQNLETAIQSCDALEVQGKILQGLIITSSLLYAEPENQKQKESKKSYDIKGTGKFANLLHKYMDKVSRESKTSILLTVVGSEDTLPIIEKVMDSRIMQSAPSVPHGNP